MGKGVASSVAYGGALVFRELRNLERCTEFRLSLLIHQISRHLNVVHAGFGKSSLGYWGFDSCEIANAVLILYF